jgi:RNA polymerase sigma-70 factor (ECF subfamily)
LIVTFARKTAYICGKLFFKVDLATDDLIRGLKEDDRKIFHQIFHKYYPMLCFEARGYINSHDLAEEIVCDVFTRLWLNRQNLNIKTSIREYLVKSVHNNCIDYYRQQKRDLRIIAGNEIPEGNHSLLELGESPLDYILTQELEEKVQELVEGLPPQYKKCFKLSRYNDLTYEEIAKEMQISVNSVKTNIKNALAIIRKGLGDSLISLIILIKLLHS